MNWEPSTCPGSPSFDGAYAYELYWNEKETRMIEVRSHDGESEIFLTRVDQFTDAESAARKLFDSVYGAAKIHGGRVVLDPPEDRAGDGWAVTWASGPKQWNHAYVVSDGADALGFVSQAEGEFTVVFRETD